MARRAGTVHVPVTRRALIARINRTLRKQDETLKAVRGDGRARQELGDYYILDAAHVRILRANVDLAAIGTELGVLAPYEKLED